MIPVVLASASTGRLAVLRGAGVSPAVVVSAVDEDAVIAQLTGAAPAEIVRCLAIAKATDVGAGLSADVAADSIVIGADSMLLLDGRLCGKPKTPDAARAQWQSLRGRSGELLTGHCVIRLRDGEITHTEAETVSTTVVFADPTEAELSAYIAGGEPLQVAGGFTLDGHGGWFVDRIDGDPSNVIGLSLPRLRRLLARTGVSIADLWVAI